MTTTSDHKHAKVEDIHNYDRIWVWTTRSDGFRAGFEAQRAFFVSKVRKETTHQVTFRSMHTVRPAYKDARKPLTCDFLPENFPYSIGMTCEEENAVVVMGDRRGHKGHGQTWAHQNPYHRQPPQGDRLHQERLVHLAPAVGDGIVNRKADVARDEDLENNTFGQGKGSKEIIFSGTVLTTALSARTVYWHTLKNLDKASADISALSLSWNLCQQQKAMFSYAAGLEKINTKTRTKTWRTTMKLPSLWVNDRISESRCSRFAKQVTRIMTTTLQCYFQHHVFVEAFGDN